MELEESSIDFKPVADTRPLLPEPPPVRLVAIDDCHVPAANGMEPQLDDFYVGIFAFERVDAGEAALVYKAENARLIFDLAEPPIERPDFRPIALQVPDLAEVRRLLNEREHAFEVQRSLMAGTETLALQDPAGNWMAVSERRELR